MAQLELRRLALWNRERVNELQDLYRRASERAQTTADDPIWFAPPRGVPNLTDNEVAILGLVAEGLTNPEIGQRLYLSRHTVKEYLSNAMRKLDAVSRVEAALKATRLGVIEPPG